MTNPLTSRRRLRIAAGLILLVVAGTVPAWAQEAATPDAVKSDAAPPEVATPDVAAEPDADASADPTVALDTDTVITPEAQAVLDRMKATFDSLQRYSISAHITRDEVLPFGYKLQNNEAARVWVERPNKLRLEVEGDIKNRTYVYDGSQMTMFAPDLNVYSVTPAPSSLHELISKLLDTGVEMPLIDFLYQGAGGNLTDDVRVGLVVGDSEVDGVATDHLAFRQPDVDWQLWVEKGERALPRKLVITTRYEVGDPQYQAVLSWDLNPRMSAKSFAFSPPAGATKIPSRTDLAAAGGDK